MEHEGMGRRSGGLDWFYEILDVERGVDMAVADAARVRSWQAATLSIAINGVLLVAFFGIWLRYDLWSTVTVFSPVKSNILGAVPDAWGAGKVIIGYILGIASALFTTLVQWSYPRMAKSHGAATWALAAVSIFDIATDYPDAKADFPIYFKGLIEMVNAQGWERWLAVSVVCFVLGMMMTKQRSLFWFLGGLCGACVILPVMGITTSTIWEWGVVFVATIFCSFVAQSLFVIHGAKVLALLAVVKRQRGMVEA